MSEPVANTNPPIVATDLVATIASSGTESTAVDLRGNTLCGIEFPSAFTGTEITFLVSDSIDGTFVELQDQFGNDITVAAAASKNREVDALSLLRARFVKIVSNASEAAERALKLFVRPI